MLVMEDERVADIAEPEGSDALLVRAIDATMARYNHTIRRAIEAAEGPGRLTMPQLRCLQAMDRAGASLTSGLARTLNVTAPTMTSMIDGLVERGLVARQPHPTDRRQMHLLLTGAGRGILARYRAITHDRLIASVSRLDAAQRARLLAAMSDLNAALDADDDPRDEREKERP